MSDDRLARGHSGGDVEFPAPPVQGSVPAGIRNCWLRSPPESAAVNAPRSWPPIGSCSVPAGRSAPTSWPGKTSRVGVRESSTVSRPTCESGFDWCRNSRPTGVPHGGRSAAGGGVIRRWRQQIRGPTFDSNPETMLGVPLLAHQCDNPLCQNPRCWRESNHRANGRDYAYRRNVVALRSPTPATPAAPAPAPSGTPPTSARRG